MAACLAAMPSIGWPRSSPAAVRHVLEHRPTLAAVIDIGSLRRRAPVIDRSSDRIVAVTAIGLAIAFLVAAGLAMFLSPADRHGAWLPLHLALAGGATTAIAGVMPFFTAAFAAAPPSDARLRLGAILAIAVGAGGVATGVVEGQTSVAAGAGLVFVVGILLVGVATIRPLGRALGPSRGLVSQGYVVALGEVAVGVTLATLFLAGWPPLVDGWAGIKPAHAWLNLVGFVTLVIATTLLHFFPTVVGARITVRRSARIAVLGLAVGAPLVALGMASRWDPMARTGALVVEAGAVALAVYAWRTWRTRARWTTDPAWHRFAIGSLVAAICWFEIGVAVATGRVLVWGANPDSWLVEAVGAPLVAGWMGLAVLGSATHLLPAVGPGDGRAHGRQRRLLGLAWAVRLGAANLGVAGLALGWPLRIDLLIATGAVLTMVGLGTTAGLLAGAIITGVRRPAP